MSSCVRLTAYVTLAWLVFSVVRGAAWFSGQVSLVTSYLDDVSDWTDIVERPLLRSAIHDIVKSGVLASVTRDTVSRVHLTTVGGEGLGGVGSDDGFDNHKDRFPKVQTLGIDVSHSGEASYIYGRFLRLLEVKRQKAERSDSDTTTYTDIATLLGFTPLVMDVGANDGFLSSNSFNLVRWGWSSVLVEPNRDMLKLAQQVQSPLIDPYQEGKQTSCYVNAGMAGVKTKEILKLKLGGDVVAMESKLTMDDDDDVKNKKAKSKLNLRDAKLARLKGGDKQSVGEKYVDVDVLPIQDIASKCSLPKKFGLLSIDAEGVGDKVLREILDARFTPTWILYEAMHNAENVSETASYVETMGYRYVRKIGWNYLFEVRGLFDR